MAHSTGQPAVTVSRLAGRGAFSVAVAGMAARCAVMLMLMASLAWAGPPDSRNRRDVGYDHYIPHHHLLAPHSSYYVELNSPFYGYGYDVKNIGKRSVDESEDLASSGYLKYQVKRDLGLFPGIGLHPYGGSVFEERSPQGLSFFPTFLHHYRKREADSESSALEAGQQPQQLNQQQQQQQQHHHQQSDQDQNDGQTKLAEDQGSRSRGRALLPLDYYQVDEPSVGPQALDIYQQQLGDRPELVGDSQQRAEASYQPLPNDDQQLSTYGQQLTPDSPQLSMSDSEKYVKTGRQIFMPPPASLVAPNYYAFLNPAFRESARQGRPIFALESPAYGDVFTIPVAGKSAYGVENQQAAAGDQYSTLSAGELQMILASMMEKGEQEVEGGGDGQQLLVPRINNFMEDTESPEYAASPNEAVVSNLMDVSGNDNDGTNDDLTGRHYLQKRSPGLFGFGGRYGGYRGHHHHHHHHGHGHGFGFYRFG